MKEGLERMKEERIAATEELNSVRSEWESEREENARLEKKVEEMNEATSRCEQRVKELKESMKRLSTVVEEKKRLEKELEKQREEKEQMGVMVAAYSQELQHQREARAQLERSLEEMDRLKQQLDEMNRLKRELKEMDNLKHQLEEKEREMNHLRQQIEEKEEEMSKLKQQLEEESKRNQQVQPHATQDSVVLPPEDSTLYTCGKTERPTASIEIEDIDADSQPRLSLLSYTTQSTATVSFTEEEESLINQLSDAKMKARLYQESCEELKQRLESLEQQAYASRVVLKEKEDVIAALSVSFKNQSDAIRSLQRTLQELKMEKQSRLLLEDVDASMAVDRGAVEIATKNGEVPIVIVRSGHVVQEGVEELKEAIQEYDSEVAAYRMNCDFWRKQLEEATKKLRRLENQKGIVEVSLREKEGERDTYSRSVHSIHRSV